MAKDHWWLPTRPLTDAEKRASGSFAEQRDQRPPPKPKTQAR